MESDAKEPTGVTRGQNAVHVMPLDWSAAERVLAPLLDRLDGSRAETQLLVVTADAESAAAAAAALVALVGDRDLRVLAATSGPRAARLLRGSAAHVVAGAPAELAGLLAGSALKPAGVRAVVFGWLDPILETPEAQPLENLLAELPKEGARVILAAELTPAYEALIERYARRARRAVETPADESLAPLSAEYVSASPAARPATLRRLLDALDLPAAVLYGRTEGSRSEAAAVARALGYPADAVRVTGGETETSNDPLVLLDLPATREELRAVVGKGARKLYAIVQPSQLASLRGLLGGGTVTPVSLVEAAERARGRDAALRAELRELLLSGDVRREVLALEPLLDEFDGIEVAAAALRMLEQQRPARPAAAASSQSLPMSKLFINLGEKDGVRARELITMITTEGGVPGSQVGKVEVRDTHSIAEVATAVAELVAGKISGVSVRGRKVQARLDSPREDRPDRPARSGPPSRGGADRDRGSARPARTFGPPKDRGDRPARPYGDRPARPAPGERPSRTATADRPQKPWEKAERPRTGAPKKFDRDGGTARPTRPRPPRSDA